MLEPGADVGSESELREFINALLASAGIVRDRALIGRLVAVSLGLGADRTERLDLKISAAALEEMREAFQLFAAYRGIPKVTIFGSARTSELDPLFELARAAAAALAECGWMVVTGAGPGIMRAASLGAGPDRALGVSIRLPFEELPNDVLQRSGRHVSMKYFFTRKLMLVKESRGFICLPGGFGTMDETFELLTLQQTGKMVPVPIVLLDRPGGTFWRGFERFVQEQLTTQQLVAPGDLDRVLITDDVSRAVAEVTGFWRNYDSLRWVGERLVLRLRVPPTRAELDELSVRFAPLLREGRIAATEPLAPERADHDRLELPRIILTPDDRAVGGLHALVRAVNSLPSAERAPGLLDDAVHSDDADPAEPGLPEDPLRARPRRESPA